MRSRCLRGSRWRAACLFANGPTPAAGASSPPKPPPLVGSVERLTLGGGKTTAGVEPEAQVGHEGRRPRRSVGVVEHGRDERAVLVGSVVALARGPAAAAEIDDPGAPRLCCFRGLGPGQGATDGQALGVGLSAGAHGADEIASRGAAPGPRTPLRSVRPCTPTCGARAATEERTPEPGAASRSPLPPSRLMGAIREPRGVLPALPHCPARPCPTVRQTPSQGHPHGKPVGQRLSHAAEGCNPLAGRRPVLCRQSCASITRFPAISRRPPSDGRVRGQAEPRVVQPSD